MVWSSRVRRGGAPADIVPVTSALVATTFTSSTSTAAANSCWCYDRADATRLAASSSAALEVLGLARGGGYWLWKPLVVRDALSRLADGAVLLYADAGCTLFPAETSSWHAKLRGLSEGRPIDAHQLSGMTIDGKIVSNGAWCRGDVARAVLGDGSGGVVGGDGSGAAVSDVSGAAGGDWSGRRSRGASGGGCSPAMLERFFATDQVEANRLLILVSGTTHGLRTLLLPSLTRHDSHAVDPCVEALHDYSCCISLSGPPSHLARRATLRGSSSTSGHSSP